MKISFACALVATVFFIAYTYVNIEYILLQRVEGITNDLYGENHHKEFDYNSSIDVSLGNSVAHDDETHSATEVNNIMPCTPKNNFIFVKTSKTAGSTVGAILFRYGLRHKLIAALPNASRISIADDQVNVTRYTCNNTFPGYNYMANHIENYNHKILNRFIPNAKFVTIVRSPYTQMESAFYYRNTDSKLQLNHFRNPFKEFVDNYEVKYSNHDIQGANGQLKYLGYPNRQYNNQSAVKQKIADLDTEMDLVLIKEYLDESLILLKKLMCWTMDDILYGWCKRSKRTRYPITKHMKEIMSKYNAADLQLYNHFNRTLWTKILNYDGDFENELHLFRIRQQEIASMCKHRENTQFCDGLKKDVPKLVSIARMRQYNIFCNQH
uniref:Galactose-3-O-sulfotransferase 4-like n=1 Tax=Saccoglossus kowalevskii TaxID=10224 RepID=A0ABM0MW15_SACKO|nr:PREDICTED: galactose-3-O-sulfotransferase 4-like [Saccoglossus kowalevskii]